MVNFANFSPKQMNGNNDLQSEVLKKRRATQARDDEAVKRFNVRRRRVSDLGVLGI